MEHVDIQDLNDNYLLCRALGHSWEDDPTAQVDSDLYRASRGVIAIHCTRCQTQRFDYINHLFEVANRYYRYPDHYRSIPGQGTRPNLRGEMLRRSLLIRSARQRRNGKKPR
jgi:hypothetical protein